MRSSCCWRGPAGARENRKPPGRRRLQAPGCCPERSGPLPVPARRAAGGRWLLCSGGLLLLLRRVLAGDLEEVLQDLVAVLRGDALGVELHAVDRQALVPQPHDDVACP